MMGSLHIPTEVHPMAKIGTVNVPGTTHMRSFHMSPNSTKVWLGSAGGGRTLVGDVGKGNGATALRIAEAAVAKAGKNRW